jgi:hypothetical protein
MAIAAAEAKAMLHPNLNGAGPGGGNGGGGGGGERAPAAGAVAGPVDARVGAGGAAALDGGAAGDGEGQAASFLAPMRGKWVDALVFAATVVMITITLLSIPQPSAISANADYQWCMRLIILLTVKHVRTRTAHRPEHTTHIALRLTGCVCPDCCRVAQAMTMTVFFTQLLCPIATARFFACSAAFYAAVRTLTHSRSATLSIARIISSTEHVVCRCAVFLLCCCAGLWCIDLSDFVDQCQHSQSAQQSERTDALRLYVL